MRWLVGAAVALSGPGCKGSPYELTDAATSPQAKAEPTPLASLSSMGNSSTPGAGGPGGGPTPDSLRYDSWLATDVLREVREPGGSREVGREAKEGASFALQAVLRNGDVSGPPKTPEVNFTAIDAARRKAEPHLTVEASPTRARFVFSGGFVLPPATELRARSDWYGHLLLWPGENTVRIIQPGALRALIGERRLDVAPLSPAEVRAAGDGTHRLNLRTRKIEVSTRAAKATFEVARLHDTGDGGALIGRFLLDLMGATPSSTICANDEVPLRAELRWTLRGALIFEAVSVSQRVDLAPLDLATPPPSVAWTASRLPAEAETLLARSEIAAFRTAPVDFPPPPQRDGQAPAQETGLTLVNSGDALRVAWIDGVPVAWVAPGRRLAIPNLLRGRYALQWRTFLGDAWDAPDLIVVPGTSEAK